MGGNTKRWCDCDTREELKQSFGYNQREHLKRDYYFFWTRPITMATAPLIDGHQQAIEVTYHLINVDSLTAHTPKRDTALPAQNTRLVMWLWHRPYYDTYNPTLQRTKLSRTYSSQKNKLYYIWSLAVVIVS